MPHELTHSYDKFRSSGVDLSPLNLPVTARRVAAASWNLWDFPTEKKNTNGTKKRLSPLEDSHTDFQPSLKKLFGCHCGL